MPTVHDYESLWHLHAQAPDILVEAYRGVDVVRWHTQVERAVMDFIEKYDSARNTVYVDKLRAFLKIWRDNRLTGSINRETLELLLNPAEILGVDAWNLNRFFMGVAEGIRVLIASEEELPRMEPEQQPAPSGGGRGGPPPDFGPEKNSVTPGQMGAEEKPEEKKPEEPGPTPAQPSLDDEVDKAVGRGR